MRRLTQLQSYTERYYLYHVMKVQRSGELVLNPDITWRWVAIYSRWLTCSRVKTPQYRFVANPSGPLSPCKWQQEEKKISPTEKKVSKNVHIPCSLLQVHNFLKVTWCAQPQRVVWVCLFSQRQTAYNIVSVIQRVPLATEPGISLIILPLMRILQRNLKRTYPIV